MSIAHRMRRGLDDDALEGDDMIMSGDDKMLLKEMRFISKR